MSLDKHEKNLNKEPNAEGTPKEGYRKRKVAEFNDNEQFNYEHFQELVRKLDKNKDAMQHYYTLLSVMPLAPYQLDIEDNSQQNELADQFELDGSHTQAVKRANLQDSIKQLQIVQHQQFSILSRIDILHDIQKKSLENKKVVKTYADASTQTNMKTGEEQIIRNLEKKYDRDMKHMEYLIAQERQFRLKEFAANFERQMESLKFMIVIETNVKIKPLKSDKLTENFKEKTFKFIKEDEKKVMKVYKIQGGLSQINS